MYLLPHLDTIGMLKLYICSYKLLPTTIKQKKNGHEIIIICNNKNQ